MLLILCIDPSLGFAPPHASSPQSYGQHHLHLRNFWASLKYVDSLFHLYYPLAKKGVQDFQKGGQGIE